jgi:hypothetical protein
MWDILSRRAHPSTTALCQESMINPPTHQSRLPTFIAIFHNFGCDNPITLPINNLHKKTLSLPNSQSSSIKPNQGSRTTVA